MIFKKKFHGFGMKTNSRIFQKHIVAVKFVFSPGFGRKYNEIYTTKILLMKTPREKF